MKYRVEAFGAQEKFKAWLARGDKILVYQNQDLGHPDIGRQMFLPSAEPRELGSQGPDTAQCGMGWRYILQSIEASLDNFEFKAVTPDEMHKDSSPSKLKVTLAKRLSYSREYFVRAENVCAKQGGFVAYGIRVSTGECVTIHSWCSMKCMTDPNREPRFSVEHGKIWVSF